MPPPIHNVAKLFQIVGSQSTKPPTRKTGEKPWIYFARKNEDINKVIRNTAINNTREE